MNAYVLALDQGTTSSRAIVFGRDGRAVAMRAAGVPADLPAAGPRRARSRGDLVVAARGGAARRWRRPAPPPPTSPPSASPTSARPRCSGTAQTGKPVANAIVWQSRVSAPICERLQGAPGHEPTVPREDGPGRRRLLLRHQDQAPARHDARPARARRDGRRAVRHRRHVPDLAAHRRQAARHRRQQRQPHAAVQHPHAATGTTSC